MTASEFNINELNVYRKLQSESPNIITQTLHLLSCAYF
jgi:hypothetical protein